MRSRAREINPISQIPKFLKRNRFEAQFSHTRSFFSDAKLISRLVQQRQKLLRLSIFEAHQGYERMIQQAKSQLGAHHQSILLRQKITPPVPGLIYIKNLLKKEKLLHLKESCFELYEKLNNGYACSNSIHKSYNHNLSSDKVYKLINFQDSITEEKKKIDAQMFRDYGSSGHDLTYFIENRNIPAFVKTMLVSELENIDIVKQQKIADELNWRLTFNVYKENKDEQTAFLWHKDIPVNGKITSITTVMGEGHFQIRHQNNEQIVYKFPMTIGSLVVLSGDSRWKWQHRVLRKFDKQNQGKHNIQRMSLVLGCK